MNYPFLRNIFLKSLLIFTVLGLAVGQIPLVAMGRLSVYNRLVPGRARLPFGETPQRSYNLSLYNLEAMFAAHEISGPSKKNETRVIVLGDSSVWGTLLRPEQTLTGQLNQRGLEVCGKPARFYNLGYPTISLSKDVLIMQRALQTEPDLLVWITTLEAFPLHKQFSSPLLENNSALAESLFPGKIAANPRNDFWSQTIFGKRRDLADWVRLQLYGVPWAATGIDQDYPERYPPAEIDLEADDTFHSLKAGDDIQSALAWEVLNKGVDLAKDAGVPVMLVNEPILISDGLNSDLRYNFYYPRWAYDNYRSEFQQMADANNWQMLDAWDAVSMEEFTNSAIHLSPRGEEIFAERMVAALEQVNCR